MKKLRHGRRSPERMCASGHPLRFNPPDCFLSDGTIVQMMVKDSLYLDYSTLIMCLVYGLNQLSCIWS